MHKLSLKQHCTYTTNLISCVNTTRTTHACDASCCAKCHAWMGHTVQVSGVARSWESKELTVQNNSNVKSEPKYQACEECPRRTCFLFLNYFLFFCRSLGYYRGLTSLLFLFRVASCRLNSALIYALGSAKYVCCKGPAALSSPSSVAKKCHTDVVV